MQSFSFTTKRRENEMCHDSWEWAQRRPPAVWNSSEKVCCMPYMLHKYTQNSSLWPFVILSFLFLCLFLLIFKFCFYPSSNTTQCNWASTVLLYVFFTVHLHSFNIVSIVLNSAYNTSIHIPIECVCVCLSESASDFYYVLLIFFIWILPFFIWNFLFFLRFSSHFVFICVFLFSFVPAFPGIFTIILSVGSSSWRLVVAMTWHSVWVWKRRVREWEYVCMYVCTYDWVHSAATNK